MSLSISILKGLPYSDNAYIVGGTVRDMLTGRDPIDVDIVVPSDAERFAKTLLRKIDGSLFFLDKRRGVLRISTKSPSPPFYYDISPMRGKDICSDLSLRDFTVDAMAISLAGDMSDIIDPHNGRSDIERKWIRALSRSSFEHDPLRLLRAFRLASTLGFEVHGETLDMIREMSSSLRVAARERIRDEFFKLLASAKSGQYLKPLHNTGLLKEILTGLDDREIEKGLIVVEKLEYLYNTLPALFSPYDVDIEEYLLNKIEDEITSATVWKWIGLYSSSTMTDESIRIASRSLRLSNRTCKLTLLAAKFIQTHFLVEDREDERFLYHFFETAGDNGIGLILCQIASITAIKEASGVAIKNGKDAISWYLHEYKRIKTSPLITGNDLIELFNIPPGPVFSHLLAMVKENRAMGKIVTRNDAISFLKKLMTNV